jgi:hypothetical protein
MKHLLSKRCTVNETFLKAVPKLIVFTSMNTNYMASITLWHMSWSVIDSFKNIKDSWFFLGSFSLSCFVFQLGFKLIPILTPLFSSLGIVVYLLVKFKIYSIDVDGKRKYFYNSKAADKYISKHPEKNLVKDWKPILYYGSQSIKGVFFGLNLMSQLKSVQYHLSSRRRERRERFIYSFVCGQLLHLLLNQFGNSNPLHIALTCFSAIGIPLVYNETYLTCTKSLGLNKENTPLTKKDILFIILTGTVWYIDYITYKARAYLSATVFGIDANWLPVIIFLSVPGLIVFTYSNIMSYHNYMMLATVFASAGVVIFKNLRKNPFLSIPVMLIHYLSLSWANMLVLSYSINKNMTWKNSGIVYISVAIIFTLLNSIMEVFGHKITFSETWRSVNAIHTILLGQFFELMKGNMFFLTKAYFQTTLAIVTFCFQIVSAAALVTKEEKLGSQSTIINTSGNPFHFTIRLFEFKDLLNYSHETFTKIVPETHMLFVDNIPVNINSADFINMKYFIEKSTNYEPRNIDGNSTVAILSNYSLVPVYINSFIQDEKVADISFFDFEVHNLTISADNETNTVNNTIIVGFFEEQADANFSNKMLAKSILRYILSERTTQQAQKDNLLDFFHESNDSDIFEERNILKACYKNFCDKFQKRVVFGINTRKGERKSNATLTLNSDLNEWLKQNNIDCIYIIGTTNTGELLEISYNMTSKMYNELLNDSENKLIHLCVENSP